MNGLYRVGGKTRRTMGFALMVAFLSFGAISGCGSSNNDSYDFAGSGQSDGSDGSDGGLGGEETPTPTETAQQTVDQLNSDFASGDTLAQYKGLSDAGVLIHQWDGAMCNPGIDFPGGNPCKKSWIPFNNSAIYGAGHSVYSIASTIINAKTYFTAPPELDGNRYDYVGVFSELPVTRNPSGGLIFETRTITQVSGLEPTKVLCMSADDMGSNGRYNSGCGCKNYSACNKFYTDTYPSRPLSSDKVAGLPASARTDCIEKCVGSDSYPGPSNDPNDWVNCSVGTQGGPTSAAQIGGNGCVLAPKVTETGPAPDWYVSQDELYYSSVIAECDGEATSGCSKLKAIMASATLACRVPGTTICYNEIGVNSKSIYVFTDNEPPTVAQQPPSPRPTGVNNGAILAYFYLNIEKGSYPPPPVNGTCKNPPGGSSRPQQEWAPNGVIDDDWCSYNG